MALTLWGDSRGGGATSAWVWASAPAPAHLHFLWLDTGLKTLASGCWCWHFSGPPPPWGRQEGGGAQAQGRAGAGKGPPPSWQALAPSYPSPKEPPGLDLVCEKQGPHLGFTCSCCWPSSQGKAQLCLLDKEESGFLCEGHMLWVRAWPEADCPPQSRGLPCGCSELYLVEPGHLLLGEAVASGRGWPSWSLDPTGQTGLGNLSCSLLSNGTQRRGACPAAGAILIQTRGP